MQINIKKEDILQLLQTKTKKDVCKALGITSQTLNKILQANNEKND